MGDLTLLSAVDPVSASDVFSQSGDLSLLWKKGQVNMPYTGPAGRGVTHYWITGVFTSFFATWNS